MLMLPLASARDRRRASDADISTWGLVVYQAIGQTSQAVASVKMRARVVRDAIATIMACCVSPTTEEVD